MLEDAYQKGHSFSGVVAPFMISASLYSLYELLKQYKTKNVEERDRNIFRIINALTMSYGIQTLNEICFIKEESGRISVGNGYEMVEYTCVYPWWYNLMETTGTYAMRALFFDGALNIGEAIQSKICVTWETINYNRNFWIVASLLNLSMIQLFQKHLPREKNRLFIKNLLYLKILRPTKRER